MKTYTNILSKFLALVVCLFIVNTVFAQDTIILSEKTILIMKDGKSIENIQVREFHHGFLVYESDGNLHDALFADIERIRTAKADYFFNANDSLEKVTAENFPLPDSLSTDITIPQDVAIKSNYIKGYNDAKKYYDGTGAAVGGFVSGMVPGLGWFVTMPVISATSPQMHSSDNPNLALLADKDYAAGYKKKATNKKLGNALGGFAVGLTTILFILSGTIVN